MVSIIVEIELSVWQYPEILHTLHRAEWVKPNLYVKAMLFALRVMDINVVLPKPSFMPLATHNFWVVSIGLQEFTILNTSGVTKDFFF